MDTSELIELKKFTGERTIKAAKMTLGYWLSLVYSAAYDVLGEVAIDVHDRWRVMWTTDDSYKVMRWEASREWVTRTEMSVGQAVKYVKNPALIMVDSGLLEGYSTMPFDNRVMLLTWIDPNDVEDLCKAAIAERGKVDKRALAKETHLKKKVWTKNGMKQIIHTGHVTFDKQTSMIATGNNWGNTIHGSYIRPYTEVYNGAMVRRPPGHLQEFDLDYFKDIKTPAHILNSVRQEARDNQVILYALFHFYEHRGYRRRVIHGYVLTTPDYRLLQSWNTGPTYKSYFVLDGCLPYLAWVGDVD